MGAVAKLDLLQEADMILTACGVRRPPAGARVIDLPCVLPFRTTQFESVAPVTPTQARLQNNQRGAFRVRGVVIQSPVAVRIHFPNGRYLSQGPTWTGTDPGNPRGAGGNMIALESEVEIERGAKIALEMSGGTAGTVDIHFWGVVRIELMPQQTIGGGLPKFVEDPVEALEKRPRYRCGAVPQNIMAAEWALGNQCTPETPEGYEDEPFNFFSPAITVSLGSQVFGTQVIIPGSNDFILKRMRAITDYSGLDGGSSAIPVFALRFPSGFAMTGGDMVPLPALRWWPVFPTARFKYGDRMILDVADMQATGTGSLSTVFEFEGVKRRKVS